MSGSRTADSRGVPTDVRGSTQHLWNLLQGRVVLATEDVLLEELGAHIDMIMGALTYYKPYEGGPEDKPEIFPTAPSCHRSFLTGKLESIFKKDEKRNGTGDGSSTVQEPKRRPSEPQVSSFDKMRRAVAQHLNVTLDVGTELLITYMMFEYKGGNITYEELVDTQYSFTTFMREMKHYYMQERMCILLAIQAILANIENEEHQFFKILESFQSLITNKKWCWGLLRSIAVAQSDVEVIEILHCLALLMYKLPIDTIEEFFKYISNFGFDELRKSEKMKMAEAVAMYSALVVSGITDCCAGVYPQELGQSIRQFISKNFVELLRNPYNIAPVFAAYDIFCKEDTDITFKMKHLTCNPSINFGAMLVLMDHYGRNSLRDRHTLSLVLSKSIFEAFESLLANYDVNHFGTNTQGFLVLAKILHHNRVAESFLCDRPLALTALYSDATTLFPLDIPSTLHIWKSLCMSVRSAELCNTIVKGVAKLNCIAEFLESDAAMYIRRLDQFKVTNLKNRKVYGIELEEDAAGMLNHAGENTCVVWELPSSSNISAFEVLRWSIQPIAEKLFQMKADNAKPSEFEEFDYGANDLHAISDFVIQFWNSTNEQVVELTNLVHPICIILEQMIKHKTDIEEKVKLVKDLLGVVSAVNKFCSEMALINYIHELLPCGDSVSLLSEMILGRESIKVTRCDVTLGFLDLMLSFAGNKKCWKQGHSSAFETQFISAIAFITENLLVSCSQWRTENEGIRLEIYLKCLKIFIHIYSLEGNDWLDLKRRCLKALASPNSCLLMALKTDEMELQDSIIVPTEGNRLLSEVMTTGLQLLLELIRFETRILKHVDSILDGMLVRLLGRLVRHRLIPKIPTLAMMILTEIAEKTTLSLLACFGNDEAAFRDIILERLDFTSEDVNLKVAVLEFFTIISQTQVGIIECFFGDGILENSIIDLIQEQNDDLAVACLTFLRSLFRQKLPLPKSRDDFWANIFMPVSHIKRGSRLDIVTTTFHILTFDLFLNGRTDSRLNKELDIFFGSEKFGNVIEAVVAAQDGTAVKCLNSIKHFLTLILGRVELAPFIPKEALIYAQDHVLEGFFVNANPEKQPKLCATLAELAIVLTTPDCATPWFISGVISNLVGTLNRHSLAVQLSLLCLVNKSFTNCAEAVDSADVENVFRILRRIFDGSAKIMERDSSEQVYPILTLSASLITTIISKQHIDVWGVPMQKELIPIVLMHTANSGIFRNKSPDVVANCLSALITLADDPFGCNLISPRSVAQYLHSNLYKFTDDGCDEPWLHVFLLCLSLNSKLLMNLKTFYVDEAVAFWGQYSSFLNLKLSVMADLTEICVGIDDAEKGYKDMKGVILCSTFVLNDILMLMPYLEKWQSVQSGEVFKAVRSVFYILQEACGLLQQPFLLQSSVGIRPRGGHVEVKLSPRVLEMQTKLWDIADICVQILVKLKGKEDQFIEKGALMPTVFQLGQLAVKASTKAERKSSTSGAGGAHRYTSILEKVLVIIYNYVTPILDGHSEDHRFQTNLRRDLCTDVVGLCDAVKRLGSCKTEFLAGMCCKMDMKFK